MKTLFLKHSSITLVIALTVLYLLLTLGRGSEIAFDYPSAVLGLFVPAAIWVTLASYGIAPVILIVFCIGLDEEFRVKNVRMSERIIKSLLYFFIMTNIFDLLFIHSFMSIHLLLWSLGLVDKPEFPF